MKAKIFQPDERKNRAAVWCDDATTGMRGATYYNAPIHGGEVSTDAGYQVCEGLGRSGNTLRWGGEYPLVDLIRAEYRKLRRELRREGGHCKEA